MMPPIALSGELDPLNAPSGEQLVPIHSAQHTKKVHGQQAEDEKDIVQPIVPP